MDNTSKIEKVKNILSSRLQCNNCGGNMSYKTAMTPFGYDRYFTCDDCGKRVL